MSSTLYRDRSSSMSKGRFGRSGLSRHPVGWIWNCRWAICSFLAIFSILSTATAFEGSDGRGWLSPVLVDPGAKLVAIDSADTECEPCVAEVPKWHAQQEVIALRFEVGTLGMGGFLSLLTFEWEHFYWELLRCSVGGGSGMWAVWGTAMGIPWHIGDRRRHEIRFGLGIMFGHLWDHPEQHYFGIMLAPEIYYVWHAAKHFALEAGVDLTFGVYSILSGTWSYHSPMFNAFVGFRI